MKAKEIQELIDYISNSGLAEVKIKTEEFELSIKKYAESAQVRVVESAPAPQPAAAPAPAPAPAPQPVASEAPAAASSNLVEIKSPMIGTFYLTPNPDAPAFVNVGDTIKAGQTVCIIEAMKLFNEIESEISGKIVKILVSNATPVEYDQPLFLVDPAG
ncbi:MAG TPA: acetyl-CoA carboxylase biotin carboxyl carrier protein [Algoriphagus sp.]|uniref:acetyl-CoA carboxylase biotin carboxyl carrier protein n=1 Tax=unclassified Algoriphagus TaxID=2641541 RepID=UPI000C4DA286|nr:MULTISPECIES: acetyl-CoA carboxylase biotin carboxyl carrier protein [unclassified Algoriphagus]MAL15563.1 acetyl-CoA carboxylase, biotin carboxyl carrier protein [Algoriphagus sp.]MAN87926.1 acetyl-CoA carboxylase, biotin carboxyl carrier protein [Algoriphagus sp.]HAH37868.1 acetyl-CoA carboxylase biotin carboxyl carrier protein [Algoriphagus sp.]HAS58883.1 acetyl-CoA carboxylase biotin carboxyl carrier protein [Algoriphagus sp.]HAZ23468.1 acetyl-CoA carboxylase biotin carboxyl carrier pro|tara:strand:+ start:8340 stop:8816 length:477 start_codon:yes stop_codon:yes gene_type:complete